MENYVLVLGSKPNSKIPKIKVENVHSANGAAEIVPELLSLPASET